MWFKLIDVCPQIRASTEEKNIFKICAVKYLIRGRLPKNETRFLLCRLATHHRHPGTQIYRIGGQGRDSESILMLRNICSSASIDTSVKHGRVSPFSDAKSIVIYSWDGVLRVQLQQNGQFRIIKPTRCTNFSHLFLE